MISQVIRYALFGAALGFVLVLVGTLVKYRLMIRSGIFVDTKNLHRNDTLVTLIRQVRPYCQTSRYRVHHKYQKFIAMVDDLVGAVINRRHKQICDCRRFMSPDYLSNAMNLLNNAVVEKNMDKSKLKSIETALRELIRTL